MEYFLSGALIGDALTVPVHLRSAQTALIFAKKLRGSELPRNVLRFPAAYGSSSRTWMVPYQAPVALLVSVIVPDEPQPRLLTTVAPERSAE